MKILIAGGTGFIGRELLRRLVKERHEVILLSRSAHITFGIENFFVETVWWDGKYIDPSKLSFQSPDIIINLCGESIAGKRWSKKRKKTLIDSRIEPTKAIVELISKLETKPKRLINISAVGYYGDVPFGEVDETSLKGKGFLSDVCDLWEGEANKVKSFGVKISICRLGIVLGKGGGMIKKIMPVFNKNLGAVMGSGNQWISWIYFDDLINSLVFVVNKEIDGIINISSPFPVTMKDFSFSFAKSMEKKCLFKIPGLILKIILGEMSDTILTGQKVIPKALVNNGFSFNFDEIEKAFFAIKNE